MMENENTICNTCFSANMCSEDEKGQVQDNWCAKACKLRYLYDLAMIPDNRRNRISLRIDKDGSDKEVFKELKAMSENVVDFVNKGKNLYIYSPVTGNGKTSWAFRFAQNYLEAIWDKVAVECRVLFISVPRLLMSLKSNDKNDVDYVHEIKDNIYKADLVIWDDIGSKNATVFEEQHLFIFIDTRLSLGKSNIFTSNLNEDELLEALGDKMTSRVYGSSIVCELKGMDKRGTAK